MQYKEIIKINNMLKNENNNEELIKILNKKNIQEIIEIIKFCEIDLRNQNKKINTYILNKIKDQEIEKENIINSNKIYNEIKQIIKYESFELGKKDALTATKIMIHLNFIFLEYCKDNTDEYAKTRELIIDYFNKVIINYINSKININFNNRIKKVNLENQFLNELYDRINKFSAYQKVLEILEMYKVNFLDFKIEGKLIKLQYNEKYNNLSRIVAQKDYLDKQNVNNMLITNEFDEKNIEDCICQDEFVYREKMKRFFVTNNLNIKMGENFTIEEWIRIFVIISKVNTEYLEKNRYSILIKTKKEWLKIFEEYGFKKDKAQKIIEELKFNSNNTDIRENPIIEYNKLCITIPAIVWTTDIYETLINIFHSRNYQLNFKGVFFEEEVRKEFENAGIKNCTCKVRQNECDMAYIFDDCLFICELKNEFQPLTNMQWYRFYKKQEQHIIQLERIYEFYKNNLEYITTKLNKNKNWKPKKIYKVLMFSNYLGQTYIKDNLIVSNYNNIINFIKKTPLCVNVMEDKNIYVVETYNYQKYPYLSKETTLLNIDDFIAYMRLPMSIWYQKEGYSEEKRYIGIKDKYLIEVKGYSYKQKFTIDNIDMHNV